MTPAALLNLFRSEVRDTVSPYLWTDPEVYAYMDDAQKMFCRLQGGVADASSTAVARIDFTAGDEFVDMSPLILKLRQVQLAADSRMVEILNFEDLETRLPVDDFGYRAQYQIDNQTGDVRAVVVGMSVNQLRLVRIPEEDGQLKLIVYRLPLTDIVGATDEVFEIDSQHHRHLLPWMKHLAHMKQDAETYDRGRSEEFRRQFEAYCDQAKQERERTEHKYRTVAYGGL